MELITTSNADEYFICGPSGFMDLANLVLINSGVDKSKIKSEQFASNASIKIVPPDAKIVSKVKALINQKEVHFNVLQNELLLDAAIRQNIQTPFSCRSGMCGTCIANCATGRVEMNEKQTFLSKDDIEKSKILLCQSKSITENITIEINS